MKKYIISISALLFTIALGAAPVSKDKAAKMAATFLGNTESSLKMVWDRVDESKASLAEDPSFYTFSNPKGGWVIVAGDDALSPILAYSPDGEFDANNIPAPTKAWFRGINKNVSKARNNNIVATASIQKEWLEPRTLSKGLSSGKLIETANWNQDSPYNDKCPKITGESGRSASGCVATAMAIYLRQQQWPEHGKGTLSGYTTSTKSYKVSGFSIDDHYYNLTNIPLTDGATSSWTDAQKTAVAQLIYDCGVMVQMDYSYTGSGAMSSDIIPALQAHMYYSGAAVEKYHTDFNNQEWFNMIKAEIDADRVILYGGSDINDNGGHQFICDGYDANYNIHINWGWGGSCNAYYSVSYIGDKKSTGVNAVFNYYDSAIFGLVKDEQGTSKESAYLSMSEYNNYCGISLASGSIKKNSQFAIKVGVILNNSTSAKYDGKVRAVLVDKDGVMKEVIGNEESLSVSKSSTSSYSYSAIDNYSCTITKDLALGDCIEIQYTLTDGSWVKLGADQSEYDSDYSNTADRLGVYDVTLIRIPDGLASGNTLYFDIIPGQKQIHDVAWSYDGTAKTYKYVKLTSGTHTILATVTYADGTVEKISRTITL